MTKKRTVEFFRVPMNEDDFSAILETCLDASDEFVVRRLLTMAIAFNESRRKVLVWRMEDE